MNQVFVAVCCDFPDRICGDCVFNFWDGLESGESESCGGGEKRIEALKLLPKNQKIQYLSGKREKIVHLRCTIEFYPSITNAYNHQ